MKNLIRIFALLSLLIASVAVSAQDTLYVMRAGVVVYKRAVKDLDSISYENSLINRKSIVEKMATDTSYSIFYQGLVATGLVDSLKIDRDRSYNNNMYQYLISTTKDMGQWYYQKVPDFRRYGFTVLMENNSVLKSNGVNDLSALKRYAASVYDQVYPEDASITNVTDRRNSLNRFIAYHIINKKLSLSMFINDYDTDHMIKTVDMYQYLEPLCANTLIEIRKERTTGEFNLINKSNETGNVIRIISSFDDKDIYNGYYYGIDKILVYDKEFQSQLSTKRLRFDFAGLFPELANNKLRGAGLTTPNLHYQIPNGYLSNLKNSDQTSVIYLTPYPKLQNYEGDEISLASTNGGVYEFSVSTPPIPAGDYEIRFGYLVNGRRGIAEIYIDSMLAGEPVNLDLYGTSPEIGYVTPGADPNDLYGFENDKMMRNHRYMKGPACFKVPVTGWTFGENARYCSTVLRKILGTYSFRTSGKHLLTVKGLISGEFMFDYIEFVPTSALESEDIF